MRWNKYTIHTTTKDMEMVCATLMDYGIVDVQIDNNIQLTDEELNRMYADFVKELPEDDGSCSVTFYLDEAGFIPEGIGTGDSPSAANEADGFEGVYVNIEEVREGLKEAAELFGIAPVTIDIDSVETEDWNNKWKENFKPFEVDNIVIKPTWEEYTADAAGKVIIELDPGMAFGTGMHETTRLCLKGLQRYLKTGARVLDLGCGSGILGIAAAKLGAGFLSLVDIDVQAIQVAAENLEQNEIETDYDLQTGNILRSAELQDELAKEPFDLVLANILADVICPLSRFVHRFLKKGGVFISSGIINYREQEVVDAIKANPELELLETEADGDWVSVICRRV